MSELTITVAGQANTGKSTLAREIVIMLERMNCADIQLEDDDAPPELGRFPAAQHVTVKVVQTNRQPIERDGPVIAIADAAELANTWSPHIIARARALGIRVKDKETANKLQLLIESEEAAKNHRRRAHDNAKSATKHESIATGLLAELARG